MNLFFITASKVAQPLKEVPFTEEKVLQRIVEKNLQTLLDIRFVATEYRLPDGTRLDTLGIAKDLRPVIIEYKKVSNKTVVGQAIDYQEVFLKHKSDILLDLMDRDIKDLNLRQIQWNNIRLICIAPNFDRRSKSVAANSKSEIELITYRYFDNHTLAFQLEGGNAPPPAKKKLTQKRSGTYKEKENPVKKQGHMSAMVLKSDSLRQKIFNNLCSEVMKIDSAEMERFEMKHYFVFKKNGRPFIFIRAFPQREIICFSVKLDPSREKLDGKLVQRGSIGGIGNIRVELETEEDLRRTFHLIEKAYRLC